MSPPRKPAAHRFRERVVRSGWVGEHSVSQPFVGDRLLSIQSGALLSVAFDPAERIVRIDADTTVRYQLANGTVVLAPTGAQITWEEQ